MELSTFEQIRIMSNITYTDDKWSDLALTPELFKVHSIQTCMNFDEHQIKTNFFLLSKITLIAFEQWLLNGLVVLFANELKTKSLKLDFCVTLASLHRIAPYCFSHNSLISFPDARSLT